MYYTYVLRSLKDKKYYIGHTKDLRKRFACHQQGEVVSTKNRRPFEILFYEAFKSIEDAQRREKYFKTSKGKSSLKQMLRASINNTTP